MFFFNKSEKGGGGGGISEPKKLLQILAFYPSTFAPEIFREIYIEIKGGWGWGGQRLLPSIPWHMLNLGLPGGPAAGCPSFEPRIGKNHFSPKLENFCRARVCHCTDRPLLKANKGQNYHVLCILSILCWYVGGFSEKILLQSKQNRHWETMMFWDVGTHTPWSWVLLSC